MAPYTDELARIAMDIDTLGVGANETAIALVVSHADAVGVAPALLSVLADASQPEVARARAFGRVATALVAATPHTSEHDLVGTPC
jgi:hypothetical protein